MATTDLPALSTRSSSEVLPIEVELQGEIDSGLDNYDRYTDLWVASVPWPARDKIRLSYTLL